jgi:LysM repeat protein
VSPRIPRAVLAILAGLAVAATAACPALADVTHVVQHGHTIEAIAHRYHVTVKAIVDANHLKDPKHLKPGQVLVIPTTDTPRKKPEKGDVPDKLEGATRQRDGSIRVAAAFLETRAERKERGHVESDSIHAVRLSQDFHIRVKDAHGHIPPSALKAFEHLMRQNDALHEPDPRLVALVGIVSNHFGGKTIEVVSGFRAYTPTQYTPHSNHNYGKALDFRVRGEPNDAVRDFCRTLRNAGCGYYPNSTFVHMDVRDTKAYWVDLSHPGEPPRYEKAGSLADEGMSDVPTETTETSPRPDPAPTPPPSVPGN